MSRQRKHIVCVVGARPNFVKIAPLAAAFAAHAPQVRVILVHTGQHYDTAMNRQFFDALRIPQPDVNLGAGAGTHAAQTADVMARFEPVLARAGADAVLVVGDVNSTLACALVAAKAGVPVLHVEAGLRSGDRSMPEELNRMLTDHVSDLLFTTEASGRVNLLREGIDLDRIHFCGNVMVDTLRAHLHRAVPARQTAAGHGHSGFADAPQGYAVLTLHRPSNVDDAGQLAALLETCSSLAASTPLFFPLHPRTRQNIDRFGLRHLIERADVLPLPPLGYLEMLGLMQGARVVLTDSGGVQEETTALGVPCVTLRENTERPVTVEQGTNTIAGSARAAIMAAYQSALDRPAGRETSQPANWDGHAAERIVAVVREWLEGRPS